MRYAKEILTVFCVFGLLFGACDQDDTDNDTSTTTTIVSEDEGDSTGGVAGTTTEDLGMTFVSLTGGTFVMGCSYGDNDCDNSESPQHSVKISPFKISAYEVTQGQWEAVMGENPSISDDCGDDCPVEYVSWDDVQDFIDEFNSQTGKNYRLPTEAEWEYAARAGTTTKYYCGDDASCLDDIAWYDDNSGDTTHPVGQKEPNAWGLYDMSGNVYEWVSDWYDHGYYEISPSTDPQGPSSGSYRVFRGGSWYKDARLCRSASRFKNSPGNSVIGLGFRLAQ